MNDTMSGSIEAVSHDAKRRLNGDGLSCTRKLYASLSIYRSLVRREKLKRRFNLG